MKTSLKLCLIGQHHICELLYGVVLSLDKLHFCYSVLGSEL